jgi:hypothetical protein
VKGTLKDTALKQRDVPSFFLQQHSYLRHGSDKVTVKSWSTLPWRQSREWTGRVPLTPEAQKATRAHPEGDMKMGIVWREGSGPGSTPRLWNREVHRPPAALGE